MKLTICIPSLITRYRYLGILLQKLNPQLTEEVELIIITDNKKRTLGAKRNELFNLSKGDYIVMLDDDDDISDDYVESLLEAINHNTDVICYDMKCSVEGRPYKMVNFSKDFNNYDTNKEYFRKPNHLMCYKRSVLEKVKWKDITYGEDFIFSDDIQPHLKTEYKINKVLYYYNYFEASSECPNPNK